MLGVIFKIDLVVVRCEYRKLYYGVECGKCYNGLLLMYS